VIKNLIFSGAGLRILALCSIPFAIICTVYTNDWILLILSYIYFRIFISTLAKNIGMHRYFAHRSFTTSKAKHIFLCYLSVLSGYGSPFMFSVIHRHHHANADTDKDIHSPMSGFWQCVFGWSFKDPEWFYKNRGMSIKNSRELLKDPHNKFINEYYNKIWLSLLIITLIINWKITVFFLLLPAGLETINANFITNWAGHKAIKTSYRNFETDDTSVNTKFLGILNFGEPYHNNHHRYPYRYNFAVMPGEFDLSGWICKKFFLETDPSRQYKF
jgi:stearoyl-CoA desaturase (delta-9 desaturase)